MTEIAEGALVKEGIADKADKDSVVDGVRTVDSDAGARFEVLDAAPPDVVAFCALAYPKKRSAREGVLGRRISAVSELWVRRVRKPQGGPVYDHASLYAMKRPDWECLLPSMISCAARWRARRS